jgi:hypothetical protein
MFELVPFKQGHLEPLMLQKINSYLPEWVRSGRALEMEKSLAFTGTVEGEIMVCGGIVHLWEGRGQLLSIFSEACGRNFLPTFRGIQKFLDNSPYRRIEISVPCEFELGHRRARMLGFELECERARLYLPNGKDCALYARVKERVA